VNLTEIIEIRNFWTSELIDLDLPELTGCYREVAQAVRGVEALLRGVAAHFPAVELRSRLLPAHI
jgi:hypothetical protein